MTVLGETVLLLAVETQARPPHHPSPIPYTHSVRKHVAKPPRHRADLLEIAAFEKLADVSYNLVRNVIHRPFSSKKIFFFTFNGRVTLTLSVNKFQWR